MIADALDKILSGTWRAGVLAGAVLAALGSTLPARAVEVRPDGRATTPTITTPIITAPPITAPTITGREWALFKQDFLTADGRIVDVENGWVTHSEGQGYGMLLALKAGDRAAFDAIWRFTKGHMQIRGDALIGWRWSPSAWPHVSDPNNASDGDILIAYALICGAANWNDAALMREGDRIVRDIERKLIVRHGDLTVLMPAAYGFDKPNGNKGRVINLSYYVYPAFKMFDAVRPGGPWPRLIADGQRLTAVARFGSRRLPPDWILLDHNSLTLPDGFKQASSYDAVRIPLYMMLADANPQNLRIFDEAWASSDATPVDYDLAHDRPRQAMREPGYQAIGALTACVVRGRPIRFNLSQYTQSTYFSSALHLLTISAVREHFPQCNTGQS